jgi:hypothetical protein
MKLAKKKKMAKATIRQEREEVTLRIPYMADTNPIHSLRARDVFVVKGRRAPRMRGNTMVAGELILVQRGRLLVIEESNE